MPFKKICLVTIFSTFCLLIWGGVVHNTQSSLACPDWPLCFGRFFPEMKGGVFIEHGHRLLASLVGFLTLLLCVFSAQSRKENSQRFSLSLLALFFVVIQGILGGITVIYKLPTVVSTSHLALSMIFFCTLIYIYHREVEYEVGGLENLDLKDNKKLSTLTQLWPKSLKVGLFLATLYFYIQMLSGALMRHLGVGVSCGLGPKFSFKCWDKELGGLATTWWPQFPQSQIHMVHRINSIVTAIFVFYICYRAILFFLRVKKIHQFGKIAIFYPIIISFIVILQLGVGILTVSRHLDPIPTTLHLGLAAVGLGTLWRYYLYFGSLEKKIFPDGIFSFVSNILDLTKPKLSALVMATCLIGILSAPGEVEFFKAIAALIFISFVVVGSCALNCYLEIDIDRKMERTKGRALPSGRLNPKFALFFGLLMLFIGIPALTLMVNGITAFLALLASVLYLFLYTPMKPKSEHAVFIGAIPGAIPPLLGWTTVTGSIDTLGLFLFLILIFWQIPHFFAISLYHAKDYGEANIKIFPNERGIKSTKFYLVFFTGALMIVSVIPGFFGIASPAYLKSAFFLGGCILIHAIRGLFLSSDRVDAERFWARKFFIGTLIYLPLLLCAIIFFK
jgi:heme o synthase